MRTFILKLIVLLPFITALAVLPFQGALCDCGVEGAVCGDPPTWNPCCEPDKYECKKVSPNDAYGTCEKKEDKK